MSDVESESESEGKGKAKAEREGEGEGSVTGGEGEPMRRKRAHLQEKLGKRRKTRLGFKRGSTQ